MRVSRALFVCYLIYDGNVSRKHTAVETQIPHARVFIALEFHQAPVATAP